MKKIRTCYILLLSCFFLFQGCKESPENISLGSYTAEPGEIEGFPEDDYGYLIYDLEQQKTVRSHNASKEFIPASVTKLFTSMFSREVLGGDFTFTTTVSYNGKIENGILKGDLYLKGSGDPELSLDGIVSLVESLKSRHIREITGNFFCDETLFPVRDMLDSNMSSTAYYNTGISPLAFNGNIIYAMRRKNKEGKIISCDLLPSLASFTSHLYNESPVYPYFRYIQNNRVETWELPQKLYWDNRLPLPVKNPGLYASEVFRKLCEIQGIRLRMPEKGETASGLKTIAAYSSRPLDIIIRNMLNTSNNLTAELLYIITAKKYSKQSAHGGFEKNLMEEYFRNNFTRIKWDNFHISKASGLTTRNRITPEQTAAILLYMEKVYDKDFKPEKILPLSGWDGTMKGRLDHPETAFRVYAKTGNIFYATALAGIFYAKSGKKYLFSVFLNDLSKRSMHDMINEKTISDSNGAAVWTKKGSASIDEFIQKMIGEL